MYIVFVCFFLYHSLMNKSCSIYTLVTLVESSIKNDYQVPFWKKTIPKSDRRALYQGTNLFQQFRTNPLTAFCLRNPVHRKNDRMTDANHIVTHNEWSINRRRRTACLQQEIRGDTCTAPLLAITYRGRRREIGQRNAVHLPHGHLPPYPTLILNPNRLNPNKKLCYCIRIARRAISVEIMSTAAQLSEH